MGWGLTINNLYLSHVTQDELASKIADDESFMQSLKERLLVLAAATPRDSKNSEGYVETWEDRIGREVGEAVNEITELSWRITLMRIALNNPDQVVSN